MAVSKLLHVVRRWKVHEKHEDSVAVCHASFIYVGYYDVSAMILRIPVNCIILYIYNVMYNATIDDIDIIVNVV